MNNSTSTSYIDGYKDGKILVDGVAVVVAAGIGAWLYKKYCQ